MRLNWYQRVAIATVLATVFLVFVGGLVRAAGAGLGCPDWPKCWGCWVPPGDVSEIDASQYDVTQFNKTKMWIEYLNRIVGVVIGLLIFATFVLSFRYFKTRPAVFWGSLLSFLLVGFQGWLGGQVVKSELHGGMVTLHMIVAIILLSLLIYTTFRATSEQIAVSVAERLWKPLTALAIAVFVLTSVQIVFGTQVREAVDVIAKTHPDLARGEWIHEVGFRDHLHRAFSWTVFLASGALLWIGVKGRSEGVIRTLVFFNAGAVVAQMVFGIALAYFGMPPAFQTLHLGFSTVLVCGQFLLILFLLKARQPVGDVTATTPLPA